MSAGDVDPKDVTDGLEAEGSAEAPQQIRLPDGEAEDVTDGEPQAVKGKQHSSSSLTTRESNPRAKYRRRQQSQLVVFVKSERFDGIMVALIMVNMAIAVHEASVRSSEDGEVHPWIRVINYCFLTIFLAEIVVRIHVEGKQYFCQVMNWLDMFVVGADIMGNILERIVGSPPSVSVLRVFRAIRLVRVIKSSPMLRELWLMLHGMGAAIKAMFWACVLVFVFLLIWSIIAVEILRPISDDMENCLYCETKPFASVRIAMNTWFTLIFAGELWNDFAVPLMKEELKTHREPWSIIIFFLAYVTINLGLVNLILTVIVDQATEARFEDARQLAQEKKDQALKAKHNLKKICQAMDEDDSGELTLEEIQTGYRTNAAFHDTLAVMDIDYADLKTVFTILDEDRSGSVTYDEFCDHLHKMKTEEAQTMLTFIKYYVMDVQLKVNETLQLMNRDEFTEMREYHQQLAPDSLRKSLRSMATSQGRLPSFAVSPTTPRASQIGRASRMERPSERSQAQTARSYTEEVLEI